MTILRKQKRNVAMRKATESALKNAPAIMISLLFLPFMFSSCL